MPDSLTTTVPDAFSVSVIVEYVKTPDNRWEDGQWRVAGVIAAGPDDQATTSPRQLHAATQARQYLHTGLNLRLYKDDAESYYYNLVSDNPGVFVICSQEAGEPLQPFIATLSYGEATSYMETDVRVERVDMPAELYHSLEHYVLANYVPEKRKKRKRENWKEAGRG